MKTAMKRVASLLLALIMILEVVAPGVVEARSAGQNRATVSDEEFIPPDGNRIDPDQNAGSHLPNFIDPDDDGYYTPPQKTPARPAQNAPAQTAPKQGNEANDVEVSDEKAPKPLTQDEAERKEKALEFSKEKEMARAKSPQEGGIENKKFTIMTRFDTSTVRGPIRKGQYFVIHLDDKLTVKDPASLKRISYNNKVITEKPVYNSDVNTITYKIAEDITKNIQVPVQVDVDYNTENIDAGEKTFTVTNSISGLGVTKPKNLLPVVVDSNGNMLSTILEPGRDDVVQVLDQGKDYKVNIDAFGDPVVQDGKIAGIRWNVRVSSTVDLMTLGYTANFTAVKGSGLGAFEDIQVNSKAPAVGEITPNPINGKLGIVDSKHHTLSESAKDLYYTFYTPVTNTQASYMLDLSMALSKRNKVGAVRLVLPQGYSQEAIREATPSRVGMNNRTTILGEFANANQARWTITDAVSTGDEGNSGLPLETRTLKGSQNIRTAKAASYKLDPGTGQMVMDKTDHGTGNLPAKESDPAGEQSVGTIAVYEVTTALDNPQAGEEYSLSGVTISQCQDMYIEQDWTLPDGVRMPSQKFDVRDAQGNSLGSYTVLGANEANKDKRTRKVTVPGVKYWKIEADGTAVPRGHKIVQIFDPETVKVGNTDYKFYEAFNYYDTTKKVHYIHDEANDVTKETPATFTVLKVDKNDATKPLPGAHYLLQSANYPAKEIDTDSNGKATFANVRPGTYSLVEQKAPMGYKLDQSTKIITISRDGEIAVTGDNVTISGQAAKTQLVYHDAYPNWPDYMNAMHYGKIDDNGDVEFYLYLKPERNQYEGSTNRNTRLNISIPGVNVTDVTAYDVGPNGEYGSKSRAEVLAAMKKQEADTLGILGSSVINADNNNKITGQANVTDNYTHKTGYQIYFPKERFNNDWGFLVKVKAHVGDKDMVNLSYDWLTNEDTAAQSKIQKEVMLTRQGKGDADAILTITNESFPRHDVSLTKLDPDKNALPGATFVIKDENDEIIASKRSDQNGLVNFSQLPPGKYVVEETIAPDGHLSNGVVFDVTVTEGGQVTYKARFKDGSGTPVPGQDYIIENEDASQSPTAGKVTHVYQHMKIKEGDGAIGTRPNVWEAYRYESLDYHADIQLSNTLKGTRFVIQFDPNLDFTQYVKEIPSIKNKAGEVIAKPYMDYQTNRLTYVFNEKGTNGPFIGSIDIVGIIPNKYFAQNDGIYEFTNVVAPGVTGIQPILDDKGNPKGASQSETISVRADYEQYDQGKGSPVSQSYYFGDVYKKGDDRYVDVIAYYNPLGDYSGGSYTLGFSWASTEYGGNANIVNWYAKGYKPAFKLDSVKIYRTLPKMTVFKDPDGNSTFDKKINLNMPLSFGLRPEQDPYTYQEVYNRNIDPNSVVRDSSQGFTLNYNPGEIQMDRAQIKAKKPLTIRMPNISPQKEGYVIKQTFKITDENAWKNLWRVFYMGNGTKLESGFANKARAGEALGDQTGQEIPTYTVQKAKLINRRYVPGNFNVHKVSRLNNKKNLPGAIFELTDAKGKVYRRQSGDDGILSFNNIAPGNYELKEVKAPEGFTSSGTTWQVSVDLNGKVTIIELGVGGSDRPIVGDNITLEVTNNPVGKKFRVYKNDVDGKPLEGAKFKITPYGKTPGVAQEATSTTSGVVEFVNPLADGTYVLEETDAPDGYKKLDQSWVVVVKGDSVKIYNYVEPGTQQKIKSILADSGTHWVNVKDRPINGWNLQDNRLSGYADGHSDPYKLGTRIIAINKDQRYVIQRYIINPEGKPISKSTATIHREKPDYQNMKWYEGTEVVKAFRLDKAITVTNVEDLRLAAYTTNKIANTLLNPRKSTYPGQPDRMLIDLPATDTPIVVDVKVPYTDENEGVGTGMDLTYDGMTYWKSDYYESVTDIPVGDATVAGGEEKDIIGSYIADDSLEISNDLKRYGFKLKKVKKDDVGEVIEGAAFKLIGPDSKSDERYMVTGKDGVIEFSGLEPGKYKLVEVEAAAGYKKPDTSWTVTVKKDGRVFIKDNNAANTNSVRSVDGFETAANRISALNRLNKLDKAFGMPEAHLAQAEEAKESAEAPEAPIAKADTAKDAANSTDASEKKDAAAPIADQISTTKQLDNFLTTFGADSGLELGEENVPNPVGAGVWEKVDPARSVGKERKQDPKTEAPMDTKILEINKVDKRFKQAFIYGETSKGAKPRVIQIHSWNDAFDVTTAKPTETNVKVYQVTSGSIDNTVANLDTMTDITKRVTWSKISNQDTGNKFRLKATIPAAIKGWILVVVDTPYTNGLAIGLGSNYTSNDAAELYDKKNYKGWLAESYPNAGSINQQASKYKVTINQPAQGGTISAVPMEAEANTPVALSANPAEGWEFVRFIVTANGQPVEVNNNQFTMPGSDVSVTAEFREKPKLYDITTQSGGNGSVTANTQKAKENDSISLNVNADPDYELDQLTVTDGAGNPVTVDMATKTFTMPPSNVTVKATFKKTSPTKYTIGIAPMENGAVSADKDSAAEGDTVNLTIKPSEGYELDKLTVTANGQAVEVTNNSFKMPAGNVSISATFKKTENPPTPEDEGTEIKEGEFAQITNEQVGLQLKLFKKSRLGESLPDAEFTLKKTDENYENPETTFGPYKAKSNKNDGSIVFVDAADKPLRLEVGHYLLEETNAPTGYQKQSAPWKIEVKEVNGRLVAEYTGPKETTNTYIDKEERAKIQPLKELDSGIRYAARTTFINTEGKTFVQRIYIDTRGYKGTGKVNVQINPVVKREEIDTPGQPPKTIKKGVKTAYRSTYEITDTTGLNLNAGSKDMQQIMSIYDLSRPNVFMVNTARWRPFDWGFDEDQINLNKGVYFIDVEGYYDDNIIKEHDADIKLNIEFFTERHFMQAVSREPNGKINYENKVGGSYQKGNVALGSVFGKPGEPGTDIGNEKSTPDQKYANGISKEYTYKGVYYKSGYVTDGNLINKVTTTMDLSPLYTSGKPEEIPKEGLILENDEQAYNITFSKHGRDDPTWKITGKEVTENRLEGAVFKLEQKVGYGWEDVEGSYVSSAFNGYFGFRNLKPGRYRLVEVQAPKGYTTIEGPLLYFTVAYTDKAIEVKGKDGVKIIDKGGYITLEYNNGAKGIYQYLDGNNKPLPEGGAPLIDFVTSGTAKNMGKIINEVPGKGEVIIHKLDENGKALPGKKDQEGNLTIGARFKLTRLSAKHAEQGQEEDGVYYGRVGEDGNLVFKELIIGNYKLEEIEPHPGHINNGQVWHFTVGGKGLDPYAEDNTTRNQNITDKITLTSTSSTMSILRPQKDDDSTGMTIRPHYGACMEFANEFKLKEGYVVQPGDYFVLKLSNNIDLKGTDANDVKELDIFADGVGTIAKADYDKDAGTVTYTFTKYANQYELKDFSNRLTAFINLDRVKDSGNQDVGLELENKPAQKKRIYVDYKFITGEANYVYRWRDEYDRHFATEDYLNMASKIVKFNQDTGEFVQYFYLNRYKKNVLPAQFRYTPNVPVRDLKVTALRLIDNTDVTKDMPASFGVNETSSNLTDWGGRSYQGYLVTPDYPAGLNVPAMNSKTSAIIKVTGTVYDWENVKKTLQSYESDAKLYQNYVTNEVPWASRQDVVYIFDNENTAKAELNIMANNPANRISVKKVDPDGNPLEGASFTLWKLDTDKKIFVPDDTKETEKDKDGNVTGIVTFDKLAAGEYQIKETKAPNGYSPIEDPIVEFKVSDKTGKILRKTKDKDGQDVYVEFTDTTPLNVVNHKPIKFKKIDGNTKDILPGAEFEVHYKEKSEGDYKHYLIWKGDKQVPLTVTADKKGEITLDLSKEGYYALKETTAPKGYIKPLGHVKEFSLIDDRFYVKERGLEGNVKKNATGNDKDRSLVFARQNPKDSNSFYGYLVINPAHDKRTYDSNSLIRCLFDPEKAVFYNAQVRRIDKEGNETPIDTETLVKPDASGRPTLNLYKAFGGKAGGTANIETTDTIIVRGLFGPRDPKKPEVNLQFEITDKDGTYTSSYQMKRDVLTEHVGYYPRKGKDQTDEAYQEALAKYLKDVSDKELTIQYGDGSQDVEILNHKGVYPFTGGFGPHRWIVIIGAVIAAVAAEEYIRRKRSSAPKGGA